MLFNFKENLNQFKLTGKQVLIGEPVKQQSMLIISDLKSRFSPYQQSLSIDSEWKVFLSNIVLLQRVFLLLGGNVKR